MLCIMLHCIVTTPEMYLNKVKTGIIISFPHSVSLPENVRATAMKHKPHGLLSDELHSGGLCWWAGGCKAADACGD